MFLSDLVSLNNLLNQFSLQHLENRARIKFETKNYTNTEIINFELKYKFINNKNRLEFIEHYDTQT